MTVLIRVLRVGLIVALSGLVGAMLLATLPAVLGNESCVEPRARAALKNATAPGVEGLEFVVSLQAELFAVPAEQEVLMLRLKPVVLEAGPLV